MPILITLFDFINTILDTHVAITAKYAARQIRTF